RVSSGGFGGRPRPRFWGCSLSMRRTVARFTGIQIILALPDLMGYINSMHKMSSQSGHYVYTKVDESGVSGPRSTPYARFLDCLRDAKRHPFFRVYRQNEMTPLRERLPSRKVSA